MYGLVGVYGRPGPLAGLLACFLSHVHLAPVLPFSLFSRKRRLSLLAYRTFALALSAPLSLSLSLSLSRYPSLPFLSLACSRRIVALYLFLEAFAFSVFGWWDSDIDEGGGGERESQQQQQQQEKGGSFCLLDT
jgi:hypothetical protein